MKDITQKLAIFVDQESALEHIDTLSTNKGVKIIAFANAHACNLCESNPEFKNALLHVDVLFRDGIGVKMLLWFFGKQAGYNLNGTDLIPKIMQVHSSKRFVFIGSDKVSVTKASEVCINKGVNVVNHLDGFNDFPTMMSFIENNQPEYLVLGMGMPKQELFSEYLKNHYSGDILIINGGAILDFLSGKFTRAPEFVRKFGLEWLYRLMKEPLRLFNRYVIGIPIFLTKVIYARFFG
ncbi:WecB/TagA/CpsF family glycosyltransferase [Aliiglaciecola sp. 2_MG-2023]|uniref:WecB/TagA/CpsF family glycosyltransferase n=1 Tax=unclassified Aliiglaciecola TaxID=2593648 RepID=UPI0026E2C90D|nr:MULTISPECIES: WecB/TagA/CpsF family glycosyltransferase [unclassified Aliiglaciecola]MDO6712202.1 WecB/TagA/CpsF family glycosyltransferase [Aliiglaciecola sp. 2_MG-2023]MDO6753560.1 WecB/TagA/CpsF family glycosyltransferase [Aliiglaciecola sp. 1_MG-2023]